MTNNTCCLASKFCTPAGAIVVGIMKIKNGMLTLETYNLDGSVNIDGISNAGCPVITPTSFIDATITMQSLVCDAGQLSGLFTLSLNNYLGGLIDNAIIQLGYQFVTNAYYGYEISCNDPSVTLLGNSFIQVVDAGAFTGSILLKIKMYGLSHGDCFAETITITPLGIYDLASGWGAGTLTGDSETYHGI